MAEWKTKPHIVSATLGQLGQIEVHPNTADGYWWIKAPVDVGIAGELICGELGEGESSVFRLQTRATMVVWCQFGLLLEFWIPLRAPIWIRQALRLAKLLKFLSNVPEVYDVGKKIQSVLKQIESSAPKMCELGMRELQMDLDLGGHLFDRHWNYLGSLEYWRWRAACEENRCA